MNQNDVQPLSVHIGNLLEDIFEKRRVHRAVLAKTMGVAQSAITRYTNRQSVLTGTLWDLSHVLEHNIFSDIAVLLPAHFTSGSTVKDNRDARIAQLEQELAAVTRERDLLLKVTMPHRLQD